MDHYPADEFTPLPDWDFGRLELWNAFCRRYRVLDDSVLLFECDENDVVLTKEIGRSRPRKILLRSGAMEEIMRREAKKVVDDHKSNTRIYDGIIYIMHTRGSDGRIVPRLSENPNLSVRRPAFCLSTLRASRQIRRNSLGGATIMPTISVI